LHGPKNTRVASDKSNLAARLSQLGRIDEAEAAYREAIAIYEGVRRMGWDHIGYAMALSGYGRFLADAGEPKDGLALAYKAVDTLEKSGRTRERHYGWVLLEIADLENAYGTCGTAISFYQKAKDVLVVAGLADGHTDVRRSNKMIGRGC
jgi:tetratricopeptide (TPR) repeat protein